MSDIYTDQNAFILTQEYGFAPLAGTKYNPYIVEDDIFVNHIVNTIDGTHIHIKYHANDLVPPA